MKKYSDVQICLFYKDDIVSKARQGVKIRLSVDDKNVKSTQLVSAIARYKRSKPYIKTCRQILDSKSKQVDYALEELLNGVF